jgi:uncharacterized protein (DUF1778 family)
MAKSKQGMWAWLQATGILKWGTEEDIKAAKKLYRRAYQRAYKKQRRAKRPEVTLSLNVDEHRYLSQMAKIYEMSLAQFIRAAALAYLNQVYLVPQASKVARLEQILSHYQNTFDRLADDARRNGNDPTFKLYGTFANHFHKMEEHITQYLRYPHSLDKTIKQAIETKPAFRAKLQAYLNARS